MGECASVCVCVCMADRCVLSSCQNTKGETVERVEEKRGRKKNTEGEALVCLLLVNFLTFFSGHSLLSIYHVVFPRPPDSIFRLMVTVPGFFCSSISIVAFVSPCLIKASIWMAEGGDERPRGREWSSPMAEGRGSAE